MVFLAIPSSLQGGMIYKAKRFGLSKTIQTIYDASRLGLCLEKNEPLIAWEKENKKDMISQAHF
jgi:hypothetical protein